MSAQRRPIRQLFAGLVEYPTADDFSDGRGPIAEQKLDAAEAVMARRENASERVLTLEEAFGDMHQHQPCPG